MRQIKVETVKVRRRQPVRLGLYFLTAVWLLIVLPLSAHSAPYAALVMDARTGEVLHETNADTRLHPASLTKMMTLYIAFQAIQHGEISLDTKVKISGKAAGEPPSKLGLKKGQSIKLRYLIRAAAVKSANDAATAIGEAISGSEENFARRMNRTAKALGMTRTTFKNAHGLTQSGHLSTARDMSVMGRHLLFDFPQYYNLFSRISADAGVRKVSHTNRRFLRDYAGADGIKTGYTSAAGFNLTASAKHGNERIIATIFGGKSTASRNAKMAELMDLGFRRSPSVAPTRKPEVPRYVGAGDTSGGKTVRLVTAVKQSLRPKARPGAAVPEPVLVAVEDGIQMALAEVTAAQIAKATPPPPPATEPAVAISRIKPEMRPEDLTLASAPAALEGPEVVTRVSTSGGRHWGINIGRYASQYKAERVLLSTALNEMATLEGSLRKVVRHPTGFDANFMGMTRETADLACRRLQARQLTCFMIGPS